jgi:hypothetical protein
MISSSSTALSTAKTPPIPVMMEPNAKLYVSFYHYALKAK